MNMMDCRSCFCCRLRSFLSRICSGDQLAAGLGAPVGVYATPRLGKRSCHEPFWRVSRALSLESRSSSVKVVRVVCRASKEGNSSD